MTPPGHEHPGDSQTVAPIPQYGAAVSAEHAPAAVPANRQQAFLAGAIQALPAGADRGRPSALDSGYGTVPGNSGTGLARQGGDCQERPAPVQAQAGGNGHPF